MTPIVDALTRFRATSLLAFWIPLALWSAVCFIVLVGRHARRGLHPVYHYHTRLALLLALPLGLLAMPLAVFFSLRALEE